MRRSRTCAWGAIIVCTVIAGCSSRDSGQSQLQPSNQAAAPRAAAISPAPQDEQPQSSDSTNESPVSQKLLESAYVERDDNNVATYRLAGPAAAAPRRVPAELLVKFRRTAARARVENALSRVPQAATLRAYRVVPQLYRVRIGQNTTLEQALDTYRSDPDVEYAEPNYELSVAVMPNDPRFADLWGLHNIGQVGGSSDADIDAPESWDLTTGDDDVVIAVIDTGIDYTHPDLAANMYRNTADCDTDTIDDDGNGFINDCYGIDTVNGDTNPSDDHGHGTHVAGTIGAVGNNGIGVTGVAWNVKMMGCKFLSSQGFGSAAGAIDCLEYIAMMKDRGVNIVATNNSWGGTAYSQALQEAIAANMDRDILFVAAAGNYSMNNDASPFYPCNYDVPSIVCVAAINRYGQLAGFSNFGRTTVDIGAPGDSILSTIPGAAYAYLSGTSMAAPHVTGAAVLLKARDNTRDWRQIKNLLITGSEAALPTSLVAGSRINANESLTCTNRQWVRKLGPNTESELQRIFRGVGGTVELSALSILCDGPAGTVSVAVSNGGGTATLRDDGNAPDVIEADGIATGSWSASQAGQFTFTFPAGETADATIDAHLRPGFPVKLPYTAGSGLSGNNVHTVVGSIDADADLEILTSAVGNGPVYAFNPDGSRVTGWPSAQAWGVGYAVVGNFDNTVSGPKVGATYTNGNMALFTQGGALRTGWPQSSGNSYGLRAPIAADVDGDGDDEFLDRTIRRADGSALALASVPQVDAVADLDGDGDIELISYDRELGRLRVHHHNGTEAPEYLQTIYAGYGSYYAAVVGDVDANGTNDIVVPVQNGGSLELRLITPWSTRTITVSTNSYGFSGLALGDLTGDGVPEILVQTSDRIHALHGDGTTVAGWPVTTGSFYTGNSAPVVGDLTGDDIPEVAVAIVSGGTSSSVHVWSADGSIIDGFPKQVPLLGQGGVPAIADLEGDDRNELIVVGEYWSGVSGDFDKVWVFDIQENVGAGPIEWGQHKAGADHKAFYDLGKNLDDEHYLTVHLRGAGSVASSTSGIACGVDCIERYANNTSVTLTATPTGGTFVAWHGACAGQSNPCTVSIQDRTSVVAQFSRQPLSVSVNDGALGSVTSAPSGISCPTDCNESFDAGTSVTLTATPVATASFSHWTGACTGSSSTCTVAMNSSKAVSAVFIPRPRLTVTLAGLSGGRVTSSPAGIDCGTTCEALFTRDAFVALTATETDEYIVNWSGACYGSSTCYLTMSDDRQVTATFVAKNELSVTKTGEAAGLIYSSPSGINCGTTCSYRFGANQGVALYLSNSWEYDVTWSGACTGTNSYCSVSMDQAREVTAHITRRPVLSLTRTGAVEPVVEAIPYGLYCGYRCTSASYTYERGAVITLTSTTPGYAASWSGACTASGIGSTCTVTMSEARSVSVHFTPLVVLTTAKSGTGTGTIVSDPAGINCGSVCVAPFVQGSSVTLVATPGPGAVFAGWSGGCTGTTSSCTVVMSSARNVTALFQPQPGLTTAIIGAAGRITSSPAGIDCGATCRMVPAENESIQLTATPTPTTVFLGWAGACTGPTPTCVVTMGTVPILVSANFAAKSSLTVTVAGSGTVQSSPSGIDCSTSCTQLFDPRAIVTLTALPSPGHEFAGWSGDCGNVAAVPTNCHLSLNAGKSVIANFRSTPPPPPPPQSGGGGGGAFDWRVLAALFALIAIRLRHRHRHRARG